MNCPDALLKIPGFVFFHFLERANIETQSQTVVSGLEATIPYTLPT